MATLESYTLKIVPVLALSCAMVFGAANDGALLDRSACIFPAYDKVPRIESYASKMEYETAIGDDRFACQKLKYSSDGLPVIAYAYFAPAQEIASNLRSSSIVAIMS